MKVRQPRSIEQVMVLADRRATIAAEVAALEAQRQEQLANINAAADITIAPLVEEAEAIIGAVEPWWAAAAAGLLKGKRKSMQIGGCKIGTRQSAEKVEHGFADDKAALAAVVDSPQRSVATTLKRVLDRNRIAALLAGKSKAAEGLRALGFRMDGGEDAFFMTPVDAGDAKVSAR